MYSTLLMMFVCNYSRHVKTSLQVTNLVHYNELHAAISQHYIMSDQSGVQLVRWFHLVNQVISALK